MVATCFEFWESSGSGYFKAKEGIKRDMLLLDYWAVAWLVGWLARQLVFVIPKKICWVHFTVVLVIHIIVKTKIRPLGPRVLGLPGLEIQ